MRLKCVSFQLISFSRSQASTLVVRSVMRTLWGSCWRPFPTTNSARGHYAVVFVIFICCKKAWIVDLYKRVKFQLPIFNSRPVASFAFNWVLRWSKNKNADTCMQNNSKNSYSVLLLFWNKKKCGRFCSVERDNVVIPSAHLRFGRVLRFLY